MTNVDNDLEELMEFDYDETDTAMNYENTNIENETEISLPPHSAFYSTLKQKNITEEE